jgi:DNA replication protein DnaC|tara:strand:+ start:2485 stop:3225 length:741 start_codon:yes stop_codon:yes gene_type:complete
MGTKQPDSEIENPFLDYREDTADEWMRAAYRMYTRQKQMEAADAAEGREFCPVEEGISAAERIQCLKVWGVPERILNNLQSLNETPPIKYARKFILDPKEAWCLILSGGKGTGKSTAAAVWLYENVPPEGAPTYQTRYWWNGTRIARTNGYAKDFEKMMQSKLMVIDDLGIEYLDKNGNFLQRLDELLDERYSNFRKTIITTNLNADAFKDRYGERVADRMREGFTWGGGFIELADDSMRKVRKVL